MLCCNTLVFSHCLYVCIIIIVSDQRELRLSMLCSRMGGNFFNYNNNYNVSVCLSILILSLGRLLMYKVCNKSAAGADSFS